MEEDIKILEEMKNNCLTKRDYIDEKAERKAQAIENLINKYKEQEKMIELMAKDITERTESCPYDLYDYKIENCDEVCDSIKVAKCFIEYYKKKAKGE